MKTLIRLQHLILSFFFILCLPGLTQAQPTPFEELTVIETIPTSVTPIYLALTPDGSKLYAAGGDISVINTELSVEETTIPMGDGPSNGFTRELAVTPDGSRVYQVMTNIRSTGPSRVVVVDVATDVVIAVIPIPFNFFGPLGIAIKPDGSRVYVAHRGRASVEVIDVATNTFAGSIFIPNRRAAPITLAFSPDGSRAYVVDRGNRTGRTQVFVINTSTEAVTGSIPLSGIGPARNWAFISITPDGNRGYVTALDGERPFPNVAVIDTNPVSPTFHEQIGLIATNGRRLANSAVTPDGTLLFVVDIDNDRVLVIDIDPNSPTFHSELGYVEVGDSPWDVVTENVPGNTLAYVSHSLAAPVYVLGPPIEGIIARLQAIVNNNPGDCADKVEDALANAETALEEFNKTSPDNQAALGNIEGAVGDLEAALNDGACPDPDELTDLMDALAAIARAVALQAIEEAMTAGGDPGEISDAQDALAEGDALRAAGQYKDAVSKYKVALAMAESANPNPRLVEMGSQVHQGELAAEVPSEYVLEAAYPNPFNPQTTIRFDLPEASVVKLVVFDVLGREVRVLVDGTREAGTHEVVFEAGNLPSGTYLYRLETSQGSFVQTMQLMK